MDISLQDQCLAIAESLADEYDFIAFADADTADMKLFRTRGIFSAVNTELSDDTLYAFINYIAENFAASEADRELLCQRMTLDLVQRQLHVSTPAEIRFEVMLPSMQQGFSDLSQSKKQHYSLELHHIPLQRFERTIIVSIRNIESEWAASVLREENDRRRENQLMDAFLKAEKANSVKTEFLSRMSYNLRVPLNDIVGTVQIASKQPDIPDRMRENIIKVEESADKLLTMVDKLLDMSRIQDGGVQFEKSPISMNNLIEYCSASMISKADSKDIKFVTDIPKLKYGHVFGDEAYLKKILMNLLDNAVKYTRRGGKISFRVNEVPSEGKKVVMRFEIEDTGIGMSKEFMEHMWDAFAQEDLPDKSIDRGIGLGLSITKDYVERMGGIIIANSREGAGSIFTVAIPFEINENPEPTRRDGSSNRLSGLNLLLVEDNELSRDIATELLQGEGARVTTAVDGQEGLDIFEKSFQGEYDAILMDVTMPVMDGLEATKRIRSSRRPDASTIPILAMTANAFGDDILKSYEAGMNAHLTKPVDIKMLQRTLMNCIHAQSQTLSRQLEAATEQANTDSLTGVKSKSSFDIEIKKLTRRLEAGEGVEFSFVMCDLNGLKWTNDHLGHSHGDELLMASTKCICSVFKHSPVFRVGGDEFIVILEGEDYDNREMLVKRFYDVAGHKYEAGKTSIDHPSVALGIADYDPFIDKNVATVLDRADNEMYKAKKKMKE